MDQYLKGALLFQQFMHKHHIKVNNGVGLTRENINKINFFPKKDETFQSIENSCVLVLKL